MSNPLVNLDDEEGDHHGGGYGHHPYSSTYGFTATSWQLRKNLTEVFNQQAVSTDNQKPGAKEAPKPETSVFHKIAQFEQRSERVDANAYAASASAGSILPAHNNKAAPFGKPPRQPTLAHNAIATGNTSKSAKTTTAAEKRCVSVYLRVRPPKEGMVNTIEILPGDPPTKVRTHAPQRSNVAKMNRDPSSSSTSNMMQSSEAPTVVREFDFQRVFGPERETEDVYSTVVAPMVDSMFPTANNGQQGGDPTSGLLFAYGATNAGKTYSILGKLPSDKRDGSNRTAMMDQRHHGIVPRAFRDILDHIEEAKIRDPDRSFDLYLSYFEIYNENIYDLLDERDANNPMFMREPLKLRESHKQTFVRGLVKRKIGNVEEGLKFARQANTKRHTSSNNINSGSSRSHCICQLQVVRRPATTLKLNGDPSVSVAGKSSGYNTDEEASQLSRQKPTTLWVVDLAGSERSKRTNVGNIRQKEGSLINKR